MKFYIFSLVLLLTLKVNAQQPKEMEFIIRPCKTVGSVDSDGTVCTEEDVKKYEKSIDRVHTKEEQRIEKLSHRRDPLKLKNADKKRTRGIWVRSGN